MSKIEEKIEQIPNEDYNFLRKRMLRLEEAYQQSTDQSIRIAVRDKTLYDICERFPDFYYEYVDSFESCKMSSLKEITDLFELVMGRYSIEALPQIKSEKEVKKILKLKDKALATFIKEYNAAVKNHDLTYYSQRIDDKLVFLTVKDGEFVGAATEVSKSQRNGECLCHACRRFRRGQEIVFVTNTAKSARGDYSSLGQNFCSDYETCNRDIEEGEELVKFLQYKLDKA